MHTGALAAAQRLRTIARRLEELAGRMRAQAAAIEEAVATVPAPFSTFPRYSQRDPAWSRKQLGPDRAGGTLGTKGCAVTASAGLAAFVGCELDPGTLNKRLREVDGFVQERVGGPRNVLRWEKVAEICPELRWGGRLSYRAGPADMERLQETLEHGPTVGELDFDLSDRDVDQHFVVLLCMNAAGDDVLAMDPWTGEVVPVGETYYNPVWGAPAGKAARVITGLRLLQPKIPRPLVDPREIVERPRPGPGEIGARGVRGVHGAPVPLPPPRERWDTLVAELLKMRVYTYVQLVGAADQHDRQPMLEWLRYLIAHGITPIVRIYQERQLPGRVAPVLMEWLPDLKDAGVVYVQVGHNEINLRRECRAGFEPDYHRQRMVRERATDWWADARVALSLGLRPCFSPFAPTEVGEFVPNATASSIEWVRAMVRELVEIGGDTLKAALQTGRVWVATHSSRFDLPLDYEPRRPDGREEDMCLRGYEWVRDAFLAGFDVDPVIVSTEGGAYSPSHLDDLGKAAVYGWEEWGDQVVEMYRFVEQSTHLAALCSWTLSDELVQDPFHLGCGWFDAAGLPRSPAIAMKA